MLESSCVSKPKVTASSESVNGCGAGAPRKLIDRERPEKWVIKVSVGLSEETYGWLAPRRT